MGCNLKDKSKIKLDTSEVVYSSMYRSVNDVLELSQKIAEFFPQPQDAQIGIYEMMLNAIEHGNLSISYQEKAALMKNNVWLEEIEYRSKTKENKDKYAFVSVLKNETSVSLIVTDMGTGFDWKSFLAKEAEHKAINGRGISLAKLISFDEIKYNDIGNEVTCVKYLG